MSSISADSVVINGSTTVTNAKQTVNGNLTLGGSGMTLSSNSNTNIVFSNSSITGLNPSQNNIVSEGSINDASSCICIGGTIGEGGGNGAYYIISVGALITGAGHENIVSGRSHAAFGQYSAILGGTGNTITDTGGDKSTHVYMLGGTGNTVTTGNSSTEGCGIIGGRSCSISGGPGQDSLVINSNTGSITSTGAINTVIGANLSSINGASSVRNSIMGGTANSITSAGASTNCSIIGGMTNTIARGTDCVIICSEGSDMALTGTGTALLINNGIYSGGNNEISSSVNNFTNGSNALVAGDQNRIQNRVTQSAIIGSASSDILTSGTGTLSGAVVVGGNNCNITSSSSATTGRTVILGGLNQTITSTGTGASLNSTILYGSGCTLSNNSNCLLGGVNASITAGLSGGVCFVDADGTSFTSGTGNRFVCRFINGYYLATNAAASTGVQLNNGDTAWGTISDIRTKKIHNEIEYDTVLRELDNVKVYNFNYVHDSHTAAKRIGCIAQEFHGAYADKLNIIEKQYSMKESDNGTLGSTPDDPLQVINEGSIRYIMLSCVKALKTRVGDLEAENADLRQQLGDIRAQLAILMATIKPDNVNN